MSITMYSKPSCVQCNATERHATSKNIDLGYVNLAEDPETLKAFQDRGLMQAPVVIVTETDENGNEVEVDFWTGYRPDKMDEYAAKTKELIAA